MANKVDSLQKILQADPIPQPYEFKTMEESQRYIQNLYQWLNRFVLKLTSSNIQNGLDSIL